MLWYFADGLTDLLTRAGTPCTSVFTMQKVPGKFLGSKILRLSSTRLPFLPLMNECAHVTEKKRILLTTVVMHPRISHPHLCLQIHLRVHPFVSTVLYKLHPSTGLYVFKWTDCTQQHVGARAQRTHKYTRALLLENLRYEVDILYIL